MNKMHNVVGICGRKRAGKDTLGDYLCTYYYYRHMSFADPLKLSLKHMFGYSDAQLYGDKKEEIDNRWGTSPRQMMQHFGTDICRNTIKDSFWIDRFKQIYNKLNDDTKVVISDVRFQNEIDAIHELGGIVIKVERATILNDLSNHESESGIDKLENIDHIFENNGTIDDLYKKFENLLNLQFILFCKRSACLKSLT